MDKAVANTLMDAAGVPHCRWTSAIRAEVEQDRNAVLDRAEQLLGYPIFVKPANAGSSVGISKAADRAALDKAIEVALREDDKVVFEEFVDGQEVECAAIGNPDDPASVSTTRPGEILAGAEFYTYDDKYKNGVSQTVIPAHLSEEKLDEVRAEARKAYLALGCAGLSRCDFFVERGTGRVLCNELNTLPGFTAISMYPKLMEHEGLTFSQLVDRLLMDTRPIGVFDSGLGGLTAVRQLRRVLPGEDIVYFGDTGRVPYGSRPHDTIVQYARQDIHFLLERGVKFIIAACGTVSSTFPPEEAARLPVPYTGVVGAASRAAVAATRNRKIGIIGTAATIRSGSYAKVIRDMMPDVEITAKACPLFVPLVESGYVQDGNPVTKLVIADYLESVRASGIDTLILGCTHYPLLKKMIGDYVGESVTLIDSGKVTAQAAAEALADLDLLSGRTEGGTARYYVSDTPDNFAEQEMLFLGEYAGGPVERIAIESY